jgi:hypothetical protein
VDTGLGGSQPRDDNGNVALPIAAGASGLGLVAGFGLRRHRARRRRVQADR